MQSEKFFYNDEHDEKFTYIKKIPNLCLQHVCLIRMKTEN